MLYLNVNLLNHWTGRLCKTDLLLLFQNHWLHMAAITYFRNKTTFRTERGLAHEPSQTRKSQVTRSQHWLTVSPNCNCYTKWRWCWRWWRHLMVCAYMVDSVGHIEYRSDISRIIDVHIIDYKKKNLFLKTSRIIEQFLFTEIIFIFII